MATKQMIDLGKITPFALITDMNGLFIPFSDGLFLMQYTGLKDKNGKEIYEGDIIIVHESGWHDTPDGEIEVCHWCVPGFQFSPHGEDYEKSHICHGWTSGIDLEVIGNIYENQELLK